jgi:molybdopterin/thiamine biosynthesis adenylyltransferase
MDAAAPITVTVEVDRTTASHVSTQHTAWMLVNLLARFERIITRVEVACPDVPLQPRVIPEAAEEDTLRNAIVMRANAVGAVPVTTVPAAASHLATMNFIVGPGEAVEGAIRVCGNGWVGAISPFGLPPGEDSDLPFGPYAAACLAASHAFLAVRALVPPQARTVAYSLWSFMPVDVNQRDGPAALPALNVDASLAGVGAIGSTWIHAIWAVRDLSGSIILADSDPAGVTRSNLNRCPLFTSVSLGRPKAEEAARICDGERLRLAPYHTRFQDIAARARAPLVISAVDTNAARAAIQSLYPPRLISASTQDLRAELLRCDPSADGACIRCYNPPEEETPDDEKRRQFLSASHEAQLAISRELAISLEDAMLWAVHGVCGYAGDRLIAHLRDSGAAAAFAVGFVSVLAGTMLAAQTVKEIMGTAHPFSGVACRSVFQFMTPESDRNAPTAYRRDERCAMCDPAAPAGQVWRTRYARGITLAGDAPTPSSP